jgi:hypothetical protein
MKQYEAVIKVMEDNGGYATLGFLYQNAIKVKGCIWKTKTPFASIRRIVQDKRYFFKIKPGLWALNDYKGKLPFNIPINKANQITENDEFNHTYYQGLLVEIGNIKKYDTFVPNQDRNKHYLNKTLNDIITLHVFYNFSYDHINNKARTVDVSWFNNRKMPCYLFEIEYSTNIQNSLLKYVELQDFNIKFYIISDKLRKREYDSKISLNAFHPIKNRVTFMDYDKLAEWHTKTAEIEAIEKTYNLP